MRIFLFFIMCLSALKPLLAMDLAIPQRYEGSRLQNLKKARLAIFNRTTWNLLIQYQYDDSENLLGTTLAPEGYVILIEPHTLSRLQVVPSGKYAGMTQLTAPENLAATIDKRDAHTCLLIHSPQGIFATLYPFECSVQEMNHVELDHLTAPPESNLLKDAFPNVRHALEEKQLPFPRLFLNLSLQSTHLKEALLPSLEASYRRLTQQWSSCRTTHTAFVHEALTVLAHAYKIVYTHLQLKAYPRIQENFSTIPLSLKDRIKDTSDASIEKALSDLRSEWRKHLSEGDTLLLEIENLLIAEKEFLDMRHQLTVPIIPQEALPNVDSPACNDQSSLSQEELLKLLLDPNVSKGILHNN